MRGLVTLFGGSGFIGEQVLRALAKKEYRVRVAVRRPWRSYRSRLLGDVGQIEIVQANVRDAESVARALRGAEAVVYSVGVLFVTGRQTFAAVQAEGPGRVASAAAALGIGPFVLISAIGADPGSPSLYARTKAEGEAAVRASLPGPVVLRPSVVFGPGDQFFNRFASMATVSPALPLIGGGRTRLQPVFVNDVAKAVAAALADPTAAGRVFELGGPQIYTFKELLELTLKEIGRKRLLVAIPWGLAGMIGRMGDLQASLHGALGLIPEPQLTSDQVLLLRRDTVVPPGAPGLAELGLPATALEPIIGTYLGRFRKGGQYADLTPPEFATS
jgi:uncharacterized protein YbjT (DUF2867 family)